MKRKNIISLFLLHFYGQHFCCRFQAVCCRYVLLPNMSILWTNV